MAGIAVFLREKLWAYLDQIVLCAVIPITVSPVAVRLYEVWFLSSLLCPAPARLPRPQPRLQLDPTLVITVLHCAGHHVGGGLWLGRLALLAVPLARQGGEGGATGPKYGEVSGLGRVQRRGRVQERVLKAIFQHFSNYLKTTDLW